MLILEKTKYTIQDITMQLKWGQSKSINTWTGWNKRRRKIEAKVSWEFIRKTNYNVWWIGAHLENLCMFCSRFQTLRYFDCSGDFFNENTLKVDNKTPWLTALFLSVLLRNYFFSKRPSFRIISRDKWINKTA